MASLSTAVAFGFNLPEIPGSGTTAVSKSTCRTEASTSGSSPAGERVCAKANTLPNAGVSPSPVNVQVFVHVDRKSQILVPLGDARTLKALDHLHQRLQSVRQDVPGSAEAQSSSGETGRHFYVRGNGAMIPISTDSFRVQGGQPGQRFSGFPVW